MWILASNDDGVYAPGLTALANALKTIATVDVVAPDRDRSGVSNSLTLDNPLRVHQLDNGFWCVEGTPTDCVHLALTGFFQEKPDLVVSGINSGSNLGDDTLYSGTVAAATEGRFLGLPAIAVSLQGPNSEHYQTAAEIVKQLVLRLRESPLPSHTILNVNVPDLPLSEIQGIEVTRLGTRHNAEHMIPGRDPRGLPIYWIGAPGPEQDAGPGTDFYAINQGKVSVTPLRVDRTCYEVFDQVAGWMLEFSW